MAAAATAVGLVVVVGLVGDEVASVVVVAMEAVWEPVGDMVLAVDMVEVVELGREPLPLSSLLLPTLSLTPLRLVARRTRLSTSAT